ncbi:MAG: glycosyltransferase [Alphaproteobacteria bacterium]|nr:glycosyltransferase [Alphaproteobacteria bacterium]
MLSVVIPTLNAATTLPATLAALAAGPVGEIVVVDGGSGDGTAAIAAGLGARVLAAPAGRGGQLAAGTRAARGDWFLLLHADTRLGAAWGAAARAFMAEPAHVRRAAAFRLVLDDDHPAARRVERLAAWRCRVLGLAYGDQGLLIARGFLERLGGVRPIPLMEDVDLARRITRHRLVLLDAPAVTSAARYRAGGYWRRPARNIVCLALYFLGVPPRVLVRIYG